ncbi:MAG TPA: type II toxin-antitoxin system VapC family toxin [Thermoanaerobaculia bacterium]|nr:type II toxin-antitoxin system VapC family toxin [Thermoanaerobaculia bacterium]
MRILLDTHCWLWMQVAPERFGPESLELLRSLDNELLFSAASAWEIAIKHALGKLDLPQPPASYVPRRMRTSGVTPLPVYHHHALRVAELPDHHRDPFDRLLVAQAQIESVPLLTADPRFAAYDVEILAA